MEQALLLLKGCKRNNKASSFILHVGIGSWHSKPYSWLVSSFRSTQNIQKSQGTKR